jgi:hypothetical protein
LYGLIRQSITIELLLIPDPNIFHAEFALHGASAFLVYHSIQPSSTPNLQPSDHPIQIPSILSSIYQLIDFSDLSIILVSPIKQVSHDYHGQSQMYYAYR